MKKVVLLAFVFLLPIVSFAQNQQGPIVFELWPNGAPSDNGLRGPEVDYVTHVSNVTVPTLTVYPAANPNGQAIIACPGGAYVDVWALTEGHHYAQWLNSQGVTLAVLKYRLPNGHKDIPMEDVHRAMDIMHEHQDEWKFVQLGIQGNSAGGHLASTASTHYDKPEHRPDFQILYYPVITLDLKYSHKGSMENLLGKNPSQELIDLYSNEKQVTEDTPQALIFHCTDDGLVPVYNSIAYYQALVEHNVPASLHIYPTGGHGFAFGDQYVYKRQFTEEVEKWLRMICPK